MSSLSERLKALGVGLGPDGLKSPKSPARFPIERVVDGEIRETPFGETFVAETIYPQDFAQGKARLSLGAPMERVAAWAREERIAETEPEAFVFLDTETTGLAGGTGTYAFLVGVGRFEAEGFRLAQFFLRDPIEEPAMLAALESFLAGCETVVTFNGKAFDVPLLEARYITNGNRPPLREAAHLDILHLARRLWWDRLPSRTLGYLEENVLGATRTEEDVPGWMIPQMYFDYLRSGDARPMKGIFYHNAMDIVTLAALTDVTAKMLSEPLNGTVEYAEDLAAIGRLFEDLGMLDEAAQILEHSLSLELPEEVGARTLERLSYLQRRRGDFSAALSLWVQAAAERQIYAHVEIAKYYEHRERDFSEAIHWTQAALAILDAEDVGRFEELYWRPQLEHRLRRVEGKLVREKGSES